jgi:hypothetical protein
MKLHKLRKIFQDINWTTQLNGSVEDDWQEFKSKYTKAVDECVPWQTFSKKVKPKWMTRRVLNLLAKKRKIWRKFKRTGRQELHQRFLELRTESDLAIAGAKRSFEDKLARNIKDDPKSFFAYARSKHNTKASVGPLRKADGSLEADDAKCAEMLNRQFSGVFTREDEEHIPDPSNLFHGSDEERVQEVQFTEEDIERRLRKLKPDKAQGPDEIHPRILRECSKQLAPALFKIFQKSLDSGEIPHDWRQANVIPLHKGGTKAAPANYRPVSLTSVVCKVLERILKDRLVIHLEENQLMHKSQHGFTKGRSCLTNLLTYLEDVTRAVDEGHALDAVYLDFSKAFDKVPHKRLLHKLKAHGIGGKILQWINSWLNGRMQKVVLNGNESSEASVLSGVPQGSVLGPILFIIFVNDMDLPLNAKILKFADDAKVYLELKDEDSALQLQRDLDALCQWSADWQMIFNVDKCSVMHFGFNNPRHSYQMNGNIISASTQMRDLGVIVDETLKPSKQCVAAVKKANRAMGMIRRTIENKSRGIILRLYKQLVRPHLDFCSQAWSPWLRKDVDLLESVQRRMTKMIAGLHDIPYEERLQRLHLTTLEKRRERGEVIEAFKILRGIEQVDEEHFFKRSHLQHTRGHSLKLNKTHCRLDVRKWFFSQKVISKFNAIPPRAALSKNVLQFKKEIEAIYSGERANDGRLRHLPY